ncbi:MAG TPA: enoyl-CoA hydratase/isomerase family protein, partial [Planctomycetota bacterium]|nr:enoyl-CoA hydratase/isomerase family protein [Planctomycetota bacterium]
MAEYSTIHVESGEGIGTITVNRPEKLNALNPTVISELAKAFGQLRDDASVGVVILTGAGEKAFIAGADIAELSKLDQAGALLNAGEGQRLTVLIEDLRKPVIAAINGFALGGGLELAMACSIRIAAEGTKLGQPEVKLGLICGYGGT